MTLSIAAAGIVSAVGFNGAASLAALRAGISGVAAEPLWDVEAGAYLRAARVDLPQWWEGLGKLVELAAPAIGECLEAALPADPRQVPVLLCTAAEGRVDRLEGAPDDVLRAIGARLNLRLHDASRTIARDQAAVGVALLLASQLLEHQAVPCCVIAGVDSYLRQPVVDGYVEMRRVMTASNSNGFFPGEAGSAVLVRRSGESGGAELQLLGVGLAQESATIESENPLQALGLAEAVRQALAQANLAFHEVDYRITDLNGEHYKFKEAALLVGRLMRKRKEERFELWHPIESLGEIGAAIGPVVLARAWHAARERYAPGPTVLCHFGSDAGERAAAVLRYS